MDLPPTGDRTPEGGRRRARSEQTRARLLDVAERLYAERGLGHVSNRTILEVAGEANKTALTYHFGPGDGLLRALLRRHNVAIAERCRARLAAVSGPVGLDDNVAALVLSMTGHLASLGVESWCARLLAQVEADPQAREVVRAEGRIEPLASVREAVAAAVEGPPAVAALRADAARIVVIGTCAEQEQAAARHGRPADWGLVGAVLTELVLGALTTPVRAG